MSGREIYHRICDADSIDAEVARLSRDELAEVSEYLADVDPQGGIPSQVWGAVTKALVPGRRAAARAKAETGRVKS